MATKTATISHSYSSVELIITLGSQLHRTTIGKNLKSVNPPFENQKKIKNTLACFHILSA